MKQKHFEILIGCLVIFVAIYFSFLIYRSAHKNKITNYYTLYAKFNNIEGVNVHTKIKLGGVDIGEVEKINIDSNYQIELKLKINPDVKIPIDSGLKITTSGFIGSKYLKLDIGGEETIFKNGEYFQLTESVMDLEDLITKFMMFNKTK